MPQRLGRCWKGCSRMAKRKSDFRRALRFIRYPLEAVAAVIIFSLFAALPVERASGLGGWIGRKIGPKLGVSKRSERNMRRALPDLDDVEIATAMREMWDNLGRVAGEMPHIRRIARWARTGDIEVVNRGYLEQYSEDGKTVIFFSGHFANWELFALISRELGVPYAQVYRAANNPLVDRLLRRFRRLDEADIIPKGPAGAKKLIGLMREGRRLGMLVDQKMNDGIPVPFFGREAMTAPALAQLALRNGCPAIPVRLERLSGCSFRATILPPLEPPETGDRHQDIALMMIEVNRLFEDWIVERPGQWLWLHRRWPDT